MNVRRTSLERETAETHIELALVVDGLGACEVSTGLGFLDHMIQTLIRHARFDLRLRCTGDLHVDDHHTVEDCALALGEALRTSLGDKRGIRRFGYAYAPLDEALARAVVDLSGRPSPHVALGFTRVVIGDLATENLTHFLESFAVASACALHVDVLKGRNDHHRAEAAFKATALSLRDAVRVDGVRIPSTKEVLA